MQELLTNGASHVTGFDISEYMLQQASESLKSFEDSKYSLIHGSCLDFDHLKSVFNEEKFDVIIANWLICHLESVEDLSTFFKNCKFLIKPKGKLFCLYHNDSVIDQLDESLSKHSFDLIRMTPVNLLSEPAVFDYKFLDPSTGEFLFQIKDFVYRKNTTVRLLQENGFEVVKIGPLELNPDIGSNGWTPEQFRDLTEEVGIVQCFLVASVE